MSLFNHSLKGVAATSLAGAVAKTAAVCLTALGVSVATPAAATIFQFDMFDHADGAEAANFDYGLRLDFLGMFFSAGPDAAGSTLQLTYDDQTRAFALQGTMRRNGDDSIWALDYRMSNVRNGATPGVNVDFGAFGESNLIADSLTCVSGACVGENAIAVGRKANGDGLFFGFGATTANDDEFDVVRGDIMTAAGWVAREPANFGCCNDFLLAGQASVVPLPAPILLLGTALVGLGMMGSRRRRNA